MAEPRSSDPAAVRGGGDEHSMAELLKMLSEQTTTLVRQEVELAKAEMSAKGRQLGLGAGMFGGAAVVGLFAVGALTAAIILALSLAMAGWLAALIVAAVYGAIAGALALVGRGRTRAGEPPIPQHAIESTKEDVAWVKTRARSGRR
jgi:Putative Actinobacterial Holin-X, holin superfamily III